MKSGCLVQGWEVKWFTCALEVCLSSENSAFGELWLEIGRLAQEANEQSITLVFMRLRWKLNSPKALFSEDRHTSTHVKSTRESFRLAHK